MKYGKMLIPPFDFCGIDDERWRKAFPESKFEKRFDDVVPNYDAVQKSQKEALEKNDSND